ncbi:hypothetical protein [Deinococcus altitudinis]|uniref:hypothetical protein n=1 Tax=Deinococcus altitudinis TaxID=468914 RepID=UPI0038912F39
MSAHSEPGFIWRWITVAIQNEKRKPGRPPKYPEQLVKDMLKMFERGNPITVVVSQHGIAESTFHRWMADSDVAEEDSAFFGSRPTASWPPGLLISA